MKIDIIIIVRDSKDHDKKTIVEFIESDAEKAANSKLNPHLGAIVKEHLKVVHGITL
jgi:hypothetical protein